MRILDSNELDCIAGGTLNCFPIFGEDGKMYSPTLDGFPGGPLRGLNGIWKIFTTPQH